MWLKVCYFVFFLPFVLHFVISDPFYQSKSRKVTYLDDGLMQIDPPKDTSNPSNELECEVRLLAYEYALEIQPFRGTQPLTFDTLNIDTYCTENNKKYIKYKKNILKKEENKKGKKNNKIKDSSVNEIYVNCKSGNDNNNGTFNSPVKSIEKALELTRAMKSNQINKEIILFNDGICYLTDSIYLSPNTYDNNLVIRSYDSSKKSVISGGILLDVKELQWSKYNSSNSNNSKANIWMTSLPNSIKNKLFNNTIFSLFLEELDGNTDKNRRLQKARYPNGDLSVFYRSQSFIHPTEVIDWYPAYGKQPNQVFKNLSCKQTNPCKNNSNMWQYNLYTAGYGDDTLCNLWYNAVFKIGNIDNLAVNNTIDFEDGGSQGGRVMTHNLNSNATNNQPVSTGPFYISGILYELDTIGEWYYDNVKNILYYYPNDTTNNNLSPSDIGINLVIGNIATLIQLGGDSMDNVLVNTSISNIDFRDTRNTFMDRWGVPSGGDWALYRGGSIMFENATNCSVNESVFSYIDNNGVIVSGYNRYINIYRNEFKYIGNSAMAGWGYTQDYDGTNGNQPRYINVVQNYIHDIGLYEIQSSIWFQAKSCLINIHKNIGFNLPRAGILFNDAFGGGNTCSFNLLYNTCTETGDHGPINSWNRMTFLTSVAYGYPSWDSMYSNVYNNFVIANYDGAQSFDTDDGSAWFNIYNNFWWNAQGYKNDYGGFNVNYYNNLNVVWDNYNDNGYTNCWGIAAVIYPEGPANTLYNNKCVILDCVNEICKNIVAKIWAPTSYVGTPLRLFNNAYYTIDNNATYYLETEEGWKYYNITEMKMFVNLENNSSMNPLPSNNQIIQWAVQILMS